MPEALIWELVWVLNFNAGKIESRLTHNSMASQELNITPEGNK